MTSWSGWVLHPDGTVIFTQPGGLPATRGWPGRVEGRQVGRPCMVKKLPHHHCWLLGGCPPHHDMRVTERWSGTEELHRPCVHTAAGHSARRERAARDVGPMGPVVSYEGSGAGGAGCWRATQRRAAPCRSRAAGCCLRWALTVGNPRAAAPETVQRCRPCALPTARHTSPSWFLFVLFGGVGLGVA